MLACGVILCLLLGAAPRVGAGQAPDDLRPQPSLSAQVGQMIMLGFRGLRVGPGDRIVTDIQEGRVGGVLLFDYDVKLDRPVRNIKNATQLRDLIRDLQTAARRPLFVALDQEGGRVARLKPRHGFPTFPGARELGKRQDPALTRATGRDMGALLSELGFNCNLAPVVDVNVNPSNPAIGRLGRSFSREPREVVVQARAFIQGLKAEGILSCLKHFPGHGSAYNDSHLGLTDVTDTWEPRELLPFQELIRSGQADMIMTGHLFNARLDPEYPATLSPLVIHGLLRRELGFSGVVISDDLQMKAISAHYSLRETVRRSINAGVDILLFANNLEYDPEIAAKVQALVLDLLAAGEIEAEAIRAAWSRIRALKERL